MGGQVAVEEKSSIQQENSQIVLLAQQRIARSRTLPFTSSVRPNRLTQLFERDDPNSTTDKEEKKLELQHSVTAAELAASLQLGTNGGTAERKKKVDELFQTLDLRGLDFPPSEVTHRLFV